MVRCDLVALLVIDLEIFLGMCHLKNICMYTITYLLLLVYGRRICISVVSVLLLYF